ncbi:hypothetical protein DFS33DRAFT_1253288, partial [Desarmillaria ectypa]
NHLYDKIDALFDIGETTMGLPENDKLEYSYGLGISSFGFTEGYSSRFEFFNISQNNIFLQWPITVRQVYPDAVNTYTESTLYPYASKDIRINLLFLETFNDKLCLPWGALTAMHTADKLSGSGPRPIGSTE